MMSTESNKSKASKSDLINELESIQNLLIEDADNSGEESESFDFEDLETDELDLDNDLDIDIPILDDVVQAEDVVDLAGVDNGEQNSRLLNLEDIFEETEPSLANNNVQGYSNETTDQQLHIHSEPEDPITEGPDAEGFAAEKIPLGTHQVTSDSEINLKDEIIPKDNADLNIDFLIQELVDEFIPVIENQLRDRLSRIQPDIIRKLADKIGRAHV